MSVIIIAPPLATGPAFSNASCEQSQRTTQCSTKCRCNIGILCKVPPLLLLLLLLLVLFVFRAFQCTIITTTPPLLPPQLLSHNISPHVLPMAQNLAVARRTAKYTIIIPPWATLQTRTFPFSESLSVAVDMVVQLNRDLQANCVHSVKFVTMRPHLFNQSQLIPTQKQQQSGRAP